MRPSPYWRPGVTLSYYLDHALGDGAPWAFHLSSLVFVLVCALLLLRALIRADVAAWPAAALAGAFVAWPLMLEPASNIASRPDLLCLIGVLGALQSKRWAPALLLTALACGSKELGVLLPLLAWLRDPQDRRWMGMAGVAAAFVLARFWVLEVSGAGPSGASVAGAGLRVVLLSSRLLVALPIAPAWTLPTGGPGLQVLGWIAALGASGVAVWKGRELGALLVAPLWMVSGVLSAEVRYGDGLLVLPLAASVLWLGRVQWPHMPRVVAGMAVVFGGVNLARQGAWQDEAHLWASAARAHPDDAQIALNLARVQATDQPALALETVRGVQGTTPRLQRELHEVRGRAWLQLGQPEAACTELMGAVGPEPEHAWATGRACTLGAGLQRAGAESACVLAVEHFPTDAAAWNALGMARIRHDVPGAIDAFDAACALEPGGAACANATRARSEQ